MSDESERVEKENQMTGDARQMEGAESDVAPSARGEPMTDWQVQRAILDELRALNQMVVRVMVAVEHRPINILAGPGIRSVVADLSPEPSPPQLVRRLEEVYKQMTASRPGIIIPRAH